MIYITGDVHAPNLNNWEQKTIGSEIKAAQNYLEILKKYNLSCTFFINGVCLDKEPNEVKRLLNYNIELGGHTYDNFSKTGIIKSYINRKIWKCVYGSKFYQKKDIKKTKLAFKRFGLEMTSWRTHAFASNDYTFSLLQDFGVKYVSDLLGNTKPFYDKVMHIPINIPVDQNTIIYGNLKPENRNPFASCTKSRIFPEEWFEIVKKRVIENEKNKLGSIILIHPGTMAVLDNFMLFEKIAKFLSKYKSKKISEFKI